MSVFKRIFCVAFAFMLFFGVPAELTEITTAAAGSVLSAETKTVNAGQQFEIAISLSDASQICGGNFTLKYDSNILAFESYSYGKILNNYTKNCNPDYQSAGNLIRFTFSGANELSSDGVLIILKFNAKKNGKSAFDFSSYKMYDADGNAVDVRAVSGSVSVVKTSGATAYAIGDVNDDGKLTAADARTVLRASAKLETLNTKAAAAADVNKDGKLTAADARKILRVSAKLEKF